ncbi:shikimate kinase [Microlunatus elymi]|uniref:Shikimate kinase n=1 Tax=Microlunatus elymi TaxID=2596828 RepID=A0A516PZZ1_9ACTN|nr:shikimate kinase [Microlunatus elymi]QDP96738.1 shikimate kinase [Microlunatus elymi]
MTEEYGAGPSTGSGTSTGSATSPGAGAAEVGPIVLVGPPSSGKTTVGRLLAAELGTDFLDVDELIEQRTGKLIGEIFADDGEPAFRELETATTIEVITDPTQPQSRVISLGGGAVTSAQIRRALTPYRVVWLRVGIAAAAKRIGLNTARPLLLGNVRGQLIKLMREREPLYAEVATIDLATDDVEPEELVQLIIDGLRG